MILSSLTREFWNGRRALPHLASKLKMRKTERILHQQIPSVDSRKGNSEWRNKKQKWVKKTLETVITLWIWGGSHSIRACVQSPFSLPLDYREVRCEIRTKAALCLRCSDHESRCSGGPQCLSSLGRHRQGAADFRIPQSQPGEDQLIN